MKEKHKKILKAALGTALIGGLGYSAHKHFNKKPSLGKKLAIGAGAAAAGGLAAHQGYHLYNMTKYANKAKESTYDPHEAINNMKKMFHHGDRTFMRFNPRYNIGKELFNDLNDKFKGN